MMKVLLIFYTRHNHKLVYNIISNSFLVYVTK